LCTVLAITSTNVKEIEPFFFTLLSNPRHLVVLSVFVAAPAAIEDEH